MASKIIVTGSINGKIVPVFEKFAKLQSKTPFSFAIVIGDLFASPENVTEDDEAAVDSLLAHKIEVPLPTYFTVGLNTLPNAIIKRLKSSSGEVCPNLYFLGKHSTTKTLEGVKIVSLGGAQDPNVASHSKDQYLPFHTEADAKALCGANSADIFLSAVWPSLVRNGSKINFPEHLAEPASERCVADLCTALRPKYHFSASNDAFYEREAFFHEPTTTASEDRLLTRFISLASYSSPAKAKWLYAFSLDPAAQAYSSATLPAGSTASPFEFSTSKKRLAPPEFEMYNRYETETHKRPRRDRDSFRPKRSKRYSPPGPEECFFCLSNPNLATQLIVSIGEESYLANAKGPLTLPLTYAGAPNVAKDGFKTSMHILFVPLTHAPTFATFPSATTRSATFTEMQRYRQAIHAMLETEAQGSLGAVTWEISRARGIHAHWQLIPVPRQTIEQGLVEAAFRVEAENEKYPPFENRRIGDGSGEADDYFRARVWLATSKDLTSVTGVGVSGDEITEGMEPVGLGTETEIVLPLPPDVRFDIQFGRRVMGKLLRLDDRLDWRKCEQPEEEEVAEAEAFKALFKKWDFSL